MRIAVVAVGTRGDVEPHAAFCAGLRRQGYDARLCAPSDLAQAIGELGVPFQPIRVSFRRLCDNDGGDALLSSDSNGIRFLRRLGRVMGDAASRVIADIREACRGADLVCYSPLGVAARYFARESGIPAFATSLQPLGRTSERPNPLLHLPKWLPGSLNRLSYLLIEQVFWQVARPLLRRHTRDKLSVRGDFHELYQRPAPVLFAYSPLVVPPPRDWMPWMHVTGYWKAPLGNWQPPPGLEEFLQAGPPPVCIGFGSMNSRRIGRILEVALEVLRRTQRRAVILTGWSGWAANRAGPGDRIYVTDAAPHDWLFPRVSAVVHHGGAGTTAAALRAGVGSVILPFFFDQAFWGRWLAARGLGPPLVAFHRLTGSTLEQALDVAERSPDIRGRLGQLSGKLLQEDGVARAVAIIGEALEEVR